MKDKIIIHTPLQTDGLPLHSKSIYEVYEKAAQLKESALVGPGENFVIYQVRQSKMNNPNFKESEYLGPGTGTERILNEVF